MTLNEDEWLKHDSSALALFSRGKLIIASKPLTEYFSPLRVTGLIRSGVLRWNERPLWYDVYSAHPPAEPPEFTRQLPPELDEHPEPMPIYYREDFIRACVRLEFALCYRISRAASTSTPTSTRTGSIC